MRTELEIREKLAELLQFQRKELQIQRNQSGPDFLRADSISNRDGIITGLCFALGYKGSVDFLESEVRAGRVSLGAELDAKIKAREVSS